MTRTVASLAACLLLACVSSEKGQTRPAVTASAAPPTPAAASTFPTAQGPAPTTSSFAPDQVMVIVKAGKVTKVQLWQRNEALNDASKLNLAAADACSKGGMGWVIASGLLDVELAYANVPATDGAVVDDLTSFSFSDADMAHPTLDRARLELVSLGPPNASPGARHQGKIALVVQSGGATIVDGTFDATVCHEG